MSLNEETNVARGAVRMGLDATGGPDKITEDGRGQLRALGFTV